MLASFLPKALIPLLVGPLESHVSRWPWTQEHRRPVFEYIALGERAMAVLLEKLVGIEVLSRCLSPANKEKMVSHQGCRI
jgi:hypothetical protein